MFYNLTSSIIKYTLSFIMLFISVNGFTQVDCNIPADFGEDKGKGLCCAKPPGGCAGACTSFIGDVGSDNYRCVCLIDANPTKYCPLGCILNNGSGNCEPISANCPKPYKINEASSMRI